MGTAPRVRRATPADRGGLLALWVDLIEHHRRLETGAPGLPGIREALLGEIERGLSSARCGLWLAELDDDEPAGFLFAEFDADEARADRAGWIHELYVRESGRRRGVASALVECADAWLSARGAARVRVRVEPGNEAGLGFWEAQGFEERSRILERA